MERKPKTREELERWLNERLEQLPECKARGSGWGYKRYDRLAIGWSTRSR